MGTMTVSATPKGFVNLPGAMKLATLTFTGSVSYATGGDTMPNLGTAGNLGVGLGFTTVHSISITAQPTAANDKYLCTYIPSSDSPTAGLIKIRDLSAASDAEVTNATDLSGVTFVATVIGK